MEVSRTDLGEGSGRRVDQPGGLHPALVLPLTPQQTMLPSARSPQLGNEPTETWTNGLLGSPAGLISGATRSGFRGAGSGVAFEVPGKGLASGQLWVPHLHPASRIHGCLEESRRRASAGRLQCCGHAFRPPQCFHDALQCLPVARSHVQGWGGGRPFIFVQAGKGQEEGGQAPAMPGLFTPPVAEASIMERRSNPENPPRMHAEVSSLSVPAWPMSPVRNSRIRVSSSRH